jgi:acetolactate synthase-1/2/3 large subunit
VIRALTRSGVVRLFAGPGAGKSTIDAAAAAGLTVVQPDSGISACVMAGVSGDLEGIPGVVLLEDAVASAAGLRTAFADLSPLVCLSRSPGSDAFRGMAATTLEASADDVSRVVRQAMRLACRHSRPVHVTVDVDAAAAAAVEEPSRDDMPADPPAEDPPPRHVIEHLAQRIRAAARPLVVTGMRARGGSDASWVRAFAEALPAPVLATWKGRGVLADPHALAFGVIDATEAARALLRCSDLVIAAGVAPDEMAPALTSTPILELPSPVGTILAELAPLLGGVRADWNVAELDRLNRALDILRGEPLAPVRLVAALRDALPPGAVATFEPACMSAAVAWHCVAPGDVVVPALSRQRGFAIPAAIAAALVRRGQVAVAVVDAWATVSAAAELAIARELGTPILVLVTGEADHTRLDIPGTSSMGVWPVPDEVALRGTVEHVRAFRTPVVADATAPGPRSV